MCWTSSAGPAFMRTLDERTGPPDGRLQRRAGRRMTADYADGAAIGPEAVGHAFVAARRLNALLRTSRGLPGCCRRSRGSEICPAGRRQSLARGGGCARPWQAGQRSRSFAPLWLNRAGSVRQVDDPGLLPAAPVRLEAGQQQAGYVQAIDSRAVGLAVVDLGRVSARRAMPVTSVSARCCIRPATNTWDVAVHGLCCERGGRAICGNG